MKNLLLVSGAMLVLFTLAGCSDDTTTTAATTTDTVATSFSLGFSSPLTRTLDGGQGGGTAGQLVVTADFDNDGLPDLAVANPTTHTISLFRGAANNTLETEVKYAVGGDGPRGLAVGDFDGDSKPDLVTISSNQVSFLLNSGSGTFPNHVELNVGTDNRSLTVKDLDGDSHLDVAVTDAGATPLHVVFSDGTAGAGNYPLFDYTSNANNIHTPIWSVAADFNQDSHADLAFVNADASYLTVWVAQVGDRAGLFAPGNTYNSYLDIPANHTALSLAVGDFDRDGRPDFLTAFGNSSEAFARVYLNTLNGIAVNAGGTTAVSAGPTGVAVGDFNWDGVVDALVVSSTGLNATGTGEADLLFGDGSGNIGAQLRYPGASNQLQTVPLAVDLNKDGKPDIVMVGPGALTVLYNTSSKE